MITAMEMVLYFYTKTFKKKLKYYTISAYIAYNDGNLDMAKTQASELERIYSEKMKEV